MRLASTIKPSRLVKAQYGMTLLEMLVTLAIAAIVLTAIAPNVQSIVAKNRTSSELNELSSVMQFARYTAIDQSTTTLLCPSSDFANCANDWNLPKIVFVDENGNGDRDNSEALLMATQAITSSNKMTGPAGPIIFLESGTINTATSIKICPKDNNVKYAKSINVNAQGRVRVSIDSDKNGIYEDTNGNDLSCS